MKTNTFASLAAMIAGAVLLLQSPVASSQNVNWSVTVGTPHAQPYYAPQPVYIEPQRVYVPPQRVYVAPQPVYVQAYRQPVAVVHYQDYYGQPSQPYYVEHRHHKGHGHHGRHHGYRD